MKLRQRQSFSVNGFRSKKSYLEIMIVFVDKYSKESSLLSLTLPPKFFHMSNKSS